MKNKTLIYSIVLASVILTISNSAYAAGSSMPWEGPLSSIETSITGPVAKIMGVIAVCAAGLGVAFGEGGSGMRKLLWIVFGLSIAFSASSFFLSFFGFSGGATI